MTKPDGHARWVRISHAILGASILALVFSGFTILLAHPRLYWGKAGNDLMPALIEFPFGARYPGTTWEPATPFFDTAGAPFTASRTVEPFNQNGWARSLHFLAAWCLVVPGLIYLAVGIARGHLRTNIVPGTKQLAPRALWHDLADHLRLRIPPATGGPQYGVLQRIAYSMVIFVAAPLVVLTGLTMSPAVTAAVPFLLDLFGGYQSARTIHFAAFVVLILFSIAHVAMVVLSGFRKQVRAMTLGGLK
jgi:thiosulfate reductase cytochrome b subunit